VPGTAKKYTLVDSFFDKHGCLPPILTKKEVEEYRNKTRSEYVNAVISFYNAANRSPAIKIALRLRHEKQGKQ
jgi:hypothetical protein